MIAITIAVVLWLVIASIGFQFIWGGLGKARAAHRDFRLRINEIEQKLVQFALVSTEYASIEGDVARLNDALVVGDSVLTLLVRLEEEAARTGNQYEVNVSEDTRLTSKKGRGVVTTSEVLPGKLFSMGLSGTYQNIYRFVHNVQRFPYFLQTQRFDIKVLGQTTEDQEQTISATWIVKFFK